VVGDALYERSPVFGVGGERDALGAEDPVDLRLRVRRRVARAGIAAAGGGVHDAAGGVAAEELGMLVEVAGEEDWVARAAMQPVGEGDFAPGGHPAPVGLIAAALGGGRVVHVDEVHGLPVKGIAVRSKSEVIIADLLFSKGLEFEYEKPLEIDGERRLPDFTITDSDSGVSYYWEHLGMLQRPSYRRN